MLDWATYIRGSASSGVPTSPFPKELAPNPLIALSRSNLVAARRHWGAARFKEGQGNESEATAKELAAEATPAGDWPA